MLDETSQELFDELTAQTGFVSFEQHTGGGVMVAVVDLTIDARGLGRQLWLTREGDDVWILGLYDFHTDEEDEGVCVELRAYGPGGDADDPKWVAGRVAGILKRLGITSAADLQGA